MLYFIPVGWIVFRTEVRVEFLPLAFQDLEAASAGDRQVPMT